MTRSLSLSACLKARNATHFIATTAVTAAGMGFFTVNAQPAPTLPPLNPPPATAPAIVPAAAPTAPVALGSPGGAPSAVSRTPGSVPSGNFKAGEAVVLDFVNADIEAVARAIGLMNNRNMVIDPRVKGTVTMTTERAVPPQTAYNLFLAQIRMQGFTVVESSGLHKVVPEADAKLQGGAVSVGSVTAGNSQIQTQIFPLNFENANNLVPVLRPLISPNNTINVNPGNNSLIITDYADNLQRIARIVAALDVSNASDVEIIGLKHALAADLAPLVLKLIEPSGTPAAAGAGQADTSFKTTLVAEPRSNSLILRAANPARVALVKSLVSKLDQPGNTSNGGAGNIYVVHLKNADATKLAVTLRAALSAEARPNTTTGVTATASVAPATAAMPSSGLSTGSTLSSGTTNTATQPSTGGQIQADPATNTLIITAPEPQYRQLRAVIEKLDGRRAQVYVESLIAEVNADRAADFGVQWQSPVGSNGSGVIGLLGTNFSASVAGANIISLATGAASGSTLPATGGNIGLMQRVNGRYVLGALARFIETTGDGNVLSTPNLLTLDNEEARIVVGENRPFVTGQFTNTGTTGGTVSPFQTIERKDVGLTLKVKPQISENGTIKLQVFQEVSDVQASTVNDSKGPTTNKRSIESTVLVEDGGVVVLGGLLKDNYSGNLEKVPGLGDIPIIGNLFKSQSRTRSKTNLMVFLRPVVLRDAAAADALSQDRYEQMRAVQQGMQPTATPVLPLAGAAILPSPANTPAAPVEANPK